MGNAGSNLPRDRHKSSNSSDIILPGSPLKGQAFVFEKKPDSRLVFQTSNEDEEPYLADAAKEADVGEEIEKSENLLEEKAAKKSALPTVFKWDGGGKQVYITGTFTGWKVIPMVRSHADFVTIIDLPEGDHQYKFYVDGEWKHDPKLVSYSSMYILLLLKFILNFRKMLKMK